MGSLAVRKVSTAWSWVALEMSLPLTWRKKQAETHHHHQHFQLLGLSQLELEILKKTEGHLRHSFIDFQEEEEILIIQVWLT